jgi:hypothetical protein
VTEELTSADIPEEWEQKFFEALLGEHAIIGRAAKAAGVSLQVIERRAKESTRFALMLDRAERVVDDILEFESLRRAIEPNERPIFQRGQLVAVTKDWDTRHLEWVLERRMPEKYHLQSRIEFGAKEADVTFKLALSDTEPTPEIEAGEITDES